ncbi:MAG: c-type cytochrome [Nitrospirota bacterium]
MKTILTIVIVLLIGVAAWTAFVYGGSYSVSVSNHDNAMVNWYLDTGVTRSIKQHSAGITPPALNNPQMIQSGAKHFTEMCVQCHGAPGTKPGEIAEGLWPKAPDLAEAASDWTAGQLFWITKNGIKFSAMPAWGPTHTDDKIWAIVAFMEKLPKLSPAHYQQMLANAPAEHEETPQ